MAKVKKNKGRDAKHRKSKEKLGYICSTCFDWGLVEDNASPITIYVNKKQAVKSLDCLDAADEFDEDHCFLYEVKLTVTKRFKKVKGANNGSTN